MEVLCFKSVVKSYKRKEFLGTKKKEVLKELSFAVYAGEIFGLLGLNGSGKTTTLKLIPGFLRADRGEVFLWGEKMPSRRVLGKVGFLPELPYLSPYLSGWEILSFFAALSCIPWRKRKEKVEQVLEITGLTQIASRLAGEYSKGMKQRLVLAQALLHQPDFYLLDEPTSGLDARTAKEMTALILSLKRDGKTVLLSSHDIDFVDRVCDRVGILVDGKIKSFWKKSEWQKEGGLELLFLREVSGTGEVGPLEIQVY